MGGEVLIKLCKNCFAICLKILPNLGIAENQESEIPADYNRKKVKGHDDNCNLPDIALATPNIHKSKPVATEC